MEERDDSTWEALLFLKSAASGEPVDSSLKKSFNTRKGPKKMKIKVSKSFTKSLTKKIQPRKTKMDGTLFQLLTDSP